MQLILMIDTSGSMQGQKIGAVTDAMENLIADLSGYSGSGDDVFIAVEFFSRNVNWMDENFIWVNSFEWKEPVCTGMTSLGKACMSLAEFMSTLKDKNARIVLLSDGCPTDDYDEGISMLENLPSFVSANRYAIAIGNDADIPSLVKFTADEDRVFRVTDLDNLLAALKMAAMPQDTQSTTVPTPKTNVNTEDDEWA